MKEETLTKILFENLENGGIKKIVRPSRKNNISFHRELGTSSFRADIFISLTRGLDPADFFDNKKINFIAIEVKIKDWRQGLYQAWKYNAFAEKSYLALYEKYAKDVDLKLFEQYNVGLIVFNEEKVVVKNRPKSNNCVSENYSVELREHLWRRVGQKTIFQMHRSRHQRKSCLMV